MTSKRKNKIFFFSKNYINKRDMTSTRKNKNYFSSKNYINKRDMTSKRKYIKSGEYTKDAILKRRMKNIFKKAKKLQNEIGKNWYQKLVNLQKSVDEVKTEKNSKFITKKKICQIWKIYKRCNIKKKNRKDI